MHLHELERSHLKVNLVCVVLSDDRYPRLLVSSYLAFGGIESPSHQLDESRLAVTILTKKHDARLCVDRELGVTKQERAPLCVAEADVHQLDEEAIDCTTRLRGEGICVCIRSSAG